MENLALLFSQWLPAITGLVIFFGAVKAYTRLLHQTEQNSKDIIILRADMNAGFTAMRSEMQAMRAEMQAGFAGIRTDFKEALADVRETQRDLKADIREIRIDRKTA